MRRAFEPQPGTPRAFSLIELLAVIAIFAVLIAILLPTLSGAMRRARGIIGMANLRTHAQAMSMYSGDYAGELPYIAEPGRLNTILPPGRQPGVPISFFDTHQYWHLALAEMYYDADFTSDVFQVPSLEDEVHGSTNIRTPYMYPCAFIAKPAYWNEETRTGPSQYGPNLVGDVMFPAHKALVVQSRPFLDEVSQGHLRATLPVATADGSAVHLASNERAAGYPRGDGPQFLEHGAVHVSDAPPLLHTIDGVRGLDTPNR